MCSSRLSVQYFKDRRILHVITYRKLILRVAAVLIVVVFCTYFHLLVFYDSFNDAVVKSAYMLLC
jgi:hypothetical protein